MIFRAPAIRFLASISLLISSFQINAASPAEMVYNTVSDSIYTVFDVNNNDLKHAVDYGSGVAVTKNVIATNCHVAIRGEQRIIKVQQQLYTTELIYHDEADDLCLLQINKNLLKPVKLRLVKLVHIGEEVYALGSPKGLEKSMSRGIISNKIPYKQSHLLQTDAAISPGSSGGGLFDANSNLIGITFSKDEGSGTEGIGFALPTEVLIKALQIKHLS